METLTASAPGSLMIMGEHAVLHNQPAIVASVKGRIFVKLTQLNEPRIEIESDRMGHHSAKIGKLSIVPRFEFVTAAILDFESHLVTGFKLEINSDFSENVGLGSSAASTIATLAVLAKWLRQPDNNEALLERALRVLKVVQKTGSGADMVASIWGGTLLFSPHTLSIEPLINLPPLKVIYLGYKTPTPQVIDLVRARYDRWPPILIPIFAAMGQAAASAKDLINEAKWPQLGELFSIHQCLQAALGVSSSEIEQLIAKINKLPQVHAAKISGSGMGDCLIALGKPSDSDLNSLGLTKIHPEARILNIIMDNKGVRYE